MSKTIFRQKLTKNFTTIPNELLNNPNLSWKAKALLCYLLSLPPDWEIHLAHLKTVSTDGYDSTVAGVNELLENKYLWRRPRCGDEPGGWEYYVYQEPQFDDPFRDGNSPTREIPESGKSVATKETEEKERTKDYNNVISDLRTQETFALTSEYADKPKREKLEAFKTRACGLMGRRTSTAWSVKELRLCEPHLDTTDEDWKYLEAYYANRGKKDFYCRKNMETLLNNWAGEIDKSREHALSKEKTDWDTWKPNE